MGSDSRRRRGSYKEKKHSKDASKHKKSHYSSSSSGDSSDSSEESKLSPDVGEEYRDFIYLEASFERFFSL